MLITVLTYPHPSKTYQELICTAGVTKDGKWVRLYPVDYRLMPKHQQFKKYQLIELDVERHGYKNDKRPESHRPILETIEVLEDSISTKGNWNLRKEWIKSLPEFTLSTAEAAYDKDKTSLAVVRPTKIIDVVVEKSDRDWKPAWEQLRKQSTLFSNDELKELVKIPYKFSYCFECEDTVGNPHKRMIEDWELGVLFLKERRRLRTEQDAVESVQKKYLEELASPKRDTQFFMGTKWPYNTWLVLGVFWPPKDNQHTLGF